MQSETVICESNKHVKILNTEKRHAGKRTARRVASQCGWVCQSGDRSAIFVSHFLHWSAADQRLEKEREPPAQAAVPD